MSIFEWLQTCTVEELAEWLVEFQEQSEENILEKFEKEGYVVTRIQFDRRIQIARMVKDLATEIE